MSAHLNSVKAGLWLWFFATIVLTVFSLIAFIKERKGAVPVWISKWDSIFTDTYQFLTIAIIVMLPISFYIPAAIGTYLLWFFCIFFFLKPDILPESIRNYARAGLIGGVTLLLWLSIWTTSYTG